MSRLSARAREGTHLPFPMGVLSTKSLGLKLKKPSASLRKAVSRELALSAELEPIRWSPQFSAPSLLPPL